MAKTKPLTATEIKHAKPRVKVYKLSDGNGLQLRIRPNGNKSWLLDFIKPQSKKRSSIGLGGYPDVSLADARKLRDRNRELVAKGIDPKDQKDTEARKMLNDANNTLEQTAKKWFQVKKTKVSPDYANDIWRSLELYLFPKLGKTPISTINAPLVIEVLRPIEASGTLETLKRVIQRTNEIMDYCVNTGLIHANPLSAIKAAFKKPKKKNFPSIEPDQLPQLLCDLHHANMKSVTRFLIYWQLHTMTRPNEAARAEWSEINFDKSLWSIPASKMKKDRDHEIPLTIQTLKILERLQPISGDRQYIFPGDRTPKTHTNAQTANDVIKRIGYEGKLVAHGLRSLASTVLNEHGFDPDLIEKALSHEEKNDVRRAYNRAKYLERRRKMMTWWSNYIEQAIFSKR
jgi:integrase